MGRHKEWRKVAKRERRRRIRKKVAIEREKYCVLDDSKPENKYWLEQQYQLELLEFEEIERQNKKENEKWLIAEKAALEQWAELQEKIKKARLERAQQDLRIKQEWEMEQQKIREAQERIKLIDEEKDRKKKEFLSRLDDFLSGDGPVPDELLVWRQTKPDTDACPFFNKTGACRFGDDCSRNHKFPGISKTILIQNFFTYFGLEYSRKNDKSDITLEYDESESYSAFKEFFLDVLPEFERFGHIVQFKICNNFEKHLRGNVYVEYNDLRSAVRAHQAMNARWYGGKQISVQFTHISDWKAAICGLYFRKKCPKGDNCNFLHVFKNPRNLFNQEVMRHDSSHNNNSSYKDSNRNWRWSESPERSSSHSHRLKHSRREKRSEFEKRKKGHFQRSSSRSRSRSRDRKYKDKKHKSSKDKKCKHYRRK